MNSAVLGASLFHAAAFLAVLGIMIACITAFGFSLGALFPDTDSDDPETVSTSFPGLAFTFISLLYGGCGAWLYYSALNAGTGEGIVLFAAASLVLVVFMITATAQRLNTFNPFAEGV